MTPNDILLPLVIKNGPTYLKHYCPTAKQLQYITREDFVTPKNDWDPSQFDDIEGAPELQIQQFPTTPIDTTESFCDTEGNIPAHKSDYEEDSVVSNASSTNYENRRRSYHSRLRKEKQKKRHRPKWKQVR